MTSEPLKGKRIQAPEYLEADCFDYKDIKSAVEGCFEETTLYLKEKEECIREIEIKKIFKKWFEDVI